MKKEMKYVRKDVMREANAMMVAAKLPRPLAMKKAWLVVKLATVLSTGAMCHFSFVRADGKLREMDAISAKAGECLVKGTGNKTPRTNMLVIDAQLGEFRSFIKANILTVG